MLKRQHQESLYEPAVLLSGLDADKLKAEIPEHAHTPVFFAELFTRARNTKCSISV